jgi:hypothetical protein
MAADSGVNDFDFLMGRWAVKNQRLKERLVFASASSGRAGEAAVGASILRGRRTHMGDQLDHGLHHTRTEDEDPPLATHR